MTNLRQTCNYKDKLTIKLFKIVRSTISCLIIISHQTKNEKMIIFVIVFCFKLAYDISKRNLSMS